MLILSSVLFLIIGAVIARRNEKYPKEILALLKNLSMLLFFASIIWMATLLPSVITGDTIDSQIAMLEQENQTVEENIDSIVNNYIKLNPHHTLPQEELKTQNAITLVTLFPEIKNDTYVLQQIETYMKNMQTIKELKKEKIDISMQKYLIFFGE